VIVLACIILPLLCAALLLCGLLAMAEEAKRRRNSLERDLWRSGGIVLGHPQRKELD
jgi:hypothetical protein